jgi:hydroxyethylthiazole kinase-like uncharacterized protein yjeF
LENLQDFIKSKIKNRKASSYKGDYGHALIVAGHKGKMGAAVIAANATLRTGVGLLTVSVPADERLVLQCAVPEAMLIIREYEHYETDEFSSIGIGPGIGFGIASHALLLNYLLPFKKPLVLDADALTIISNSKELLSQIPKGTIITPHIGEFDRLFGVHQNNENRIKTAILKSKELRIIIVLKGHRTAIVSDDEVFYNTTGNSGLAKGGSGDALTGVITSFLAQGYTPIDAANVGVYIHGLAADLSLIDQSRESMSIMNVIDNFGKAFKKIRT